MIKDDQFFVQGISSSLIPTLNAISASEVKLESDERLICTDLICEGPVEGLVDKEGNLLKYVTDSKSASIENVILSKGVYYNDVPLMDEKLDKFNFVTLGFDIRYGEEFNNYTYEVPSTIHRYNQKLYLNESQSFEDAFTSVVGNYPSAGIFCFKQEGSVISVVNLYNETSNLFFTAFSEKLNTKYQTSLNYLVALMDNAKSQCQEFNHKIQNKYCDQISVQIRADQLFRTESGNVKAETAYLGIEISEDNSPNRFFAILALTGISKSGYVIDLPFNLKLDSVNKNSYYVKVFGLSCKILPTNGTIFKDFSVTSIVEKILTRGSFSYPFSCIVRSSVSSRHFNQDPNRTFDLKLLKIKVPKNYDSEAHEYTGDWDGNFDTFLRWTDNPAWIYYDICTNKRYGVGNGKIFDKDLNKWELYKISKYCDELVRTTSPQKYSEDEFQISSSDSNSIIISKITSDGYSRTLDDIKKQYPPIIDGLQFTNANGGLHNSVIYLYNLTNDDGQVDDNYKKIIWSIEEIGSDADGNEVLATQGQGTYFRLKLINDFGPRKIFESNGAGNIFNQFTNSNVYEIQANLDLKSRIQKNKNNTEFGAKSFILEWFKNHLGDSDGFVASKVNAACFPSDLLVGTVKGSCLPKTLYYRDALETRFSCNVLIDNETECLKLLNDLASVFRGLTYYKNNFITATIDVNKPVSYLFNNTNVKDGSFVYSSGSIDGNYTVAKVMYRDRFQNYDQQVEIVEDSMLMKEYGLVTKEILGFGITTRDQAKRIGQWLLATNRFENQTVTFATDLQGVILKPSDVIQIEDQNKNDSLLQGRVTSVNYENKYITVDRKLNLNSTGQIIKFIGDLKSTTIEDLNAKATVSDADIDSLNSNNIIELKIDRIENDTNRVYFDTTYKFADFTRLISSTLFIIENSNSNYGTNLYKIISISETDNNEYALFCIKHDPSKYEFLTKNGFEDKTTFVNNTISYADSDLLKEIDLSGLPNYYNIINYTINEVNAQLIDYSFNEIQSSLTYKSGKDYSVLTLNFINIFNHINEKAVSGTDAQKKYFGYIKEVLDKRGGLLCKITLRNQCLKIKIDNDNISNKNIFLGKLGNSANPVSSTSGLRIYLYDKENKIIEV